MLKGMIHFQTKAAEITYGRNTTYERYAPNQDTGIAAKRRLLASANHSPNQTPTDVYNEIHSIA
jgi:hypothetical protein